MTDSTSLHFPYYGCVSAVMIFLTAWVAAQALDDRRLKRFGNPQLLGLAGLWPHRICSALFLAGAAGALAALVGGTSTPSHLPSDSPGLVVFLVDPPARLPGRPFIDTVWGDYGRDLRLAVESIKPERIAVYLCGSPPRIAVPATKDIPGALLLLDAGSPDYEASTASAVEASVEALRLISSRADPEAASAVVVVSPKAEQDIDAAANAVRGGPPVIFVRSTLGKETLGYRREGPNTQWMHLDLPEPLRASATNLPRQDKGPEWPDTQVLALTAFLLLFLECAYRLAWSDSEGSTRRTLPHRGRCDTMAEGTSGTGFSRCLLLAMICLAARHTDASPSGQTGASHSISLEAIGPHVAVVTEISDEEPYVGQQFSVIYKLRCSIPPAAVDVDPQDFTGFWTVTAPTTGQARAEPVTLNGRTATDFLLRQLIVFPLRAGKQALPPLQLKIKQNVGSRDDWDLTRRMRPVAVNVRPVPVTEDKRDAFFMVGSLEARLSGGDGGRTHEAVLEVEGTANLDFFRPEQWLKTRDGQPVLIRLRDAETLIQTRDYEGKRRLALLQRQRWVVSAFAGKSAAVRVESFSVPFFDPQATIWRSLQVPAFALGDGSGAPEAAQILRPDLGSPGQSHRRVFRPSAPVTIAFTVSCLALLAVIVARLRRRTVEHGATLLTQKIRRAGTSS